jgi:hypothetical protein
MRNQILKLVFIAVAVSLSLGSVQAQIPTANSFASQVNYTGIYRYGVNMGYSAGWTSEQTATVAAGNASVKGAGLRSYRIPLYDDFLSSWGVEVELPKFRAFATLGAGDHTAFVGNPSAAHRDPATYPGSPEQSKTFRNLYEPIWLDAGQTQINPNNYYAKYLYDVVRTYGQYVKFWEVMNEPDFTYTASGWDGTWMNRNPTPEDMPNFRAPIFHYVRMMRISWEVVKRLQPDDFVCVGGLGYVSFLDAVMRNTDNPTDGTVNSTYPLKGGAYFDVISYHSYPMYDVRTGNRNSDKAAAAFIATRNSMDNLAMNYGYNGAQYPRKQFIATETGLSRFMQGDTWGSNEGQRNYAIKASVLAQKNGVRQAYWFNLSDGGDANNQHDRMGMYFNLANTSPYNQTPTDQGKAFKTTTDFLYGKTYDAGRTAALALPSTVEGAAFRGTDGTYTYVLWAKTILDLNESATATYSFPATVIAGANVVKREWDFAYTNSSVTIPKTVIALTGSPSFFTDGGGIATSGNQVPVSKAGTDQAITLPVNSATLTGSGIDADGNIMSYAWSKISGPSGGNLLSPMQASTLASDLVQGVYLFELKVSDNIGAIGKDTVQVTVNAAPVATGRIEAESFVNQYGTQVETTSDAGGGQNVGYIDAGDWMEYNINPAATGTYTINLRIATQNSGGQVQIKKADGTTLGTVSIPATGGWQSWQTITTTVNLTAGNQAIRIYSGNGNWNINWLEIVQGGTTTVPSAPVTTSRIEAENYTAQYGTQNETTSDAGGGQNVGYIDAGDWMEYTIAPTVNGTYTVNFRVATQNTGGQIQVKKLDGTTLGTAAIPATGGWQSWQTISTTIQLTAGSQSIRIYSGNGNWNINWFEVVAGGTTVTTPTPTSPSTSLRIEAESYINQYGTQKETTADAGGGQNVGYIDNGDWMDYTINPATSGTYTISVRIASTSTGGQIQLKKADGTVIGTVSLPNSGGWQTWQTATGTVTLNAGQQTLRLFSATAVNFNINWFELAGGGTTTTPTTNTTTSIKLEAEAFSAQYGIQAEGTSDAGGGQNIGYIDAGDWMDYPVNITTAGTYAVNFRIATPSGGRLEVRNSSGTVLSTVTIPNTGGYQTWQTITANVTLPAGQQTLRIHAATNNWNMNWWEISSAATVATRVAGDAEIVESGALNIYPNPITDRFQLGITNDRTGAVSVQVLDPQGTVQKQFSLTKNDAGPVQFYLTLGTLPAGNYVIKVTMGDWTETQPIVKQ